MLLKSIKLVNFRQFINESIDFAEGKDGKNVTIILGENGTGKTTFAQAFFWCLYGDTEFSDKIMLNRKVANDMRPGQEEKVIVTLRLRHGEVEYTIVREQAYHKDFNGKVRGDNTIIDIAYKGADGNTTYVKKSLCEREVKSDISQEKKAGDFADAVKGLLGLNAMFAAIGHFNPRSKSGVIGSYDSSYDSKSNSKIQEYIKTIEECKDKIAAIDARIEELDDQIEAARGRKTEKTEELKQYAEGEELQRQKEVLLKKSDNAQKSKANVVESISASFNADMSAFFSAQLIQRALKMLSEKDFTGKDIPFMHAKTIEYLLKQRVCICGTHLDEGTVPCEKVKSLIDFLPPQSISTTIADFKKESKHRIDALDHDLFGKVAQDMAVISQQDEDIDELFGDLHSVESRLSGGDVREKVRAINSEIQLCDQTLRKCSAERDQKISEKGGLERDRDRAETERSKLALLDEKNKMVEIYKAYAEQIYRDLIETYTQSEAQIRQRLQETINDIFKQIYEGGLSLTIDEKYHISVYANDYEGDGVETSTAQSISVIFAFITAIIKMARENRNASDEDTQLLSSEPYPLVMDAPLSAFDKRRIKTVCTALPETAEQVIIFIKDTDGALAEEYMGSRIGSRHRFDKKDEFETTLV